MIAASATRTPISSGIRAVTPRRAPAAGLGSASVGAPVGCSSCDIGWKRFLPQPAGGGLHLSYGSATPEPAHGRADERALVVPRAELRELDADGGPGLERREHAVEVDHACAVRNRARP